MNSIVSFISGPINPIWDKLDQVMLPAEPGKAFEHSLPVVYEEELVSSKVKEKVDSYVRTLGLDPSRFIYIERTVPGHGRIDSFGSIRGRFCGVILIDPRTARDIASNFSDATKFALARELAHFEQDDHYTIENQIISKTATVKLVAYAAAMIATSYFIPVIPAHLTSCAIAKAAGAVRGFQLKQVVEVKADLWAAAKSTRLAKGGIALMQKLRQANVAAASLVSEEASHHSGWRPAIVRLCLKALVKENGDSRLDPISTREATLSRLIK